MEYVFLLQLLNHFYSPDVYSLNYHVAKGGNYLSDLIFLPLYVFNHFLSIFVAHIQPVLQVVEAAGCLPL